MTDPTKPASGSDPKTSEKEARELIRVQQEDANGCVLATLAMLTGDTYSQVKAAFIGHDFSKTGCCSEFEGCNYLRDRGFVYQKMYQHNGLTKTDRTEWPILWADSPLLVGYMAQVALGNSIHAVAVKPDGAVLDPWREGEYRLTDYVQCNHLIAVFNIQEERLAAYASSREAAKEKLIGELVEALEKGARYTHFAEFHSAHNRPGAIFEDCIFGNCQTAVRLLARARGGQKK